jgi:hypothetical protein
MIPVSYIPVFVKVFFRGMPSVWKSRHQLIFCWLILMQALYPGRKTLKELSRWSPRHVTEWRFRRLLKAGYWSVYFLLRWFAWEVIKTLPAPENKTAYVISDSSEKNKRGKKNPVVQKGRKSKSHPWFFGIRFIVVVLCWDVYRIPFDFRIILPKTHPEYKKENVLFREMLENFQPPDWAERVIVLGDAAYGSKDNMKMIAKKAKTDRQRHWGFVFSLARTWNIDEKKKDGKYKKLKDLVTHLPVSLYRKTWIPPFCKGQRRKVFWIYAKRLRLCHIGEVTVVLSRKRRNVSPKRTKILVTNLTELTPRQVLCIYQRRWSVELIFWELKSGLGLGQHQVTKEEDRIEKSIGVAIIAYLFLLRTCRNEIRPGHSWSIFQLQNSFRLRMITNQIEHNMELKIEKLQKAA